MASKENKAVETNVQNTAAATAAAPEDKAEYSAAEFAAVARSLFNASPDIVTAALRCAGVNKATKSAAKEIVEKFRKKEVK